MDQGEVSEVRVFISTNLEWDCGSLSFSACTTTQDWLRKNYIYIEKLRKALKCYIHSIEIVLHRVTKLKTTYLKKRM